MKSSKFTSRKFLICIAAMLGSIGTSIAGLNSGDERVVLIGTVSSIVSAAIYAFCEAWVDSAAVSQSQPPELDQEEEEES